MAQKSRTITVLNPHSIAPMQRGYHPASEELFDATLAELHGVDTSNATAIRKDDPRYKDGARYVRTIPAVPRMFEVEADAIISGNGASAHIGTRKSRRVPASVVASLAQLSADETALLLSRFPSDGTEPGKPDDPAAVNAVLRKAIAAIESVGSISWQESRSVTDDAMLD